jgi:bifunctional non-homologous end joining protein LigD
MLWRVIPQRSTASPPAAPPLEDLAPMLLRERIAPPDESGWTHELKMDGYRVLAEICDGRVRLQTRNGSDASGWFPELLPSLAKLSPGRHVLDGEVCVLDDWGRADFNRLQNRAKRRGYRDGFDPAVYCAFDVLVHRGLDVRSLPLANRKAILRRLLRRKLPHILLVQDFPGRGEWLYLQARELQLEGIVSKRLASEYRSGVRSDDWVKVKRPGAVPPQRFKQA